MSDKERLEEIKEARKRILNEKSFQKKYIFLNSFEELGYLDWIIKQAEKAERYEKAIKECIERMDEGGAGTRSFVYEKLSEALEGEE